MAPERQRQFGRLLWRERMARMLEIASAVGIGVGLFAGLLWLRGHGGPAWIGLTLAGAAALAKPALIVIRVLETRRRRKQWD
jgi:hypothetical protein